MEKKEGSGRSKGVGVDLLFQESGASGNRIVRSSSRGRNIREKKVVGTRGRQLTASSREKEEEEKEGVLEERNENQISDVHKVEGKGGRGSRVFR